VNTDELWKLLDLDSVDPSLESPSTLKLNTPASTNSQFPTALKLDDWARRQGLELHECSDRLRQLGVTADAVADFHGAAFLPDPQLQSGCVDPLRYQFLQQLLETPDYQAWHASTQLCEPAAAVASVALAEQFVQLQRSSPDGESDDLDALRAAARAARDAGEQVEELFAATTTFGLGSGSPGSLDAKAVAELFKRVRHDPVLRRVCERAGRYRRVAQSQQRRKAIHGVDDMVGITLGGNLSHLLSSELARLMVPELELETLRRVLENAALCREFRMMEPVGKGPIIVVVDESGSMQGGPVETAKALALALAWIARQQRRWVGLIAYSGETGERLLSLPPTRWNETELLDWVKAFLGNGSSLDVPIRELPEYYRRLGAPAGQTDVLLITDAICHIPPEYLQPFLTWKHSAKARVVSLILGRQPGDLKLVSDEVHCVDKLSPEEASVAEILSV
jgi:uncharacterized protein with von Willebrand factor type A (vWA) domain